MGVRARAKVCEDRVTMTTTTTLSREGNSVVVVVIALSRRISVAMLLGT